MNKTSEWVKLEVGDNWGSIFYTYEGERLNEFGTNATENALRLSKDQLLEVQFRDGTVMAAHLDCRPETSVVYDHGKQQQVRTARYGLSMQYHGSLVWIPLEEVRVKKGSLQRKGRA